MKIERVNIGEVIKNYMKGKISNAELARKINLHRQNINKTVFEKKSLDTDLLVLISEALGHNFFQYYKCDEVCNKMDYDVKIEEVKTYVKVKIDNQYKELSFNGVET